MDQTWISGNPSEGYGTSDSIQTNSVFWLMDALGPGYNPVAPDFYGWQKQSVSSCSLLLLGAELLELSSPFRGTLIWYQPLLVRPIFSQEAVPAAKTQQRTCAPKGELV